MFLRFEAHYSSRISGLGCTIEDIILAQTVSFEELNNQMAFNIKLIEALQIEDNEVEQTQQFLKQAHSYVSSHFLH